MQSSKLFHCFISFSCLLAQVCTKGLLRNKRFLIFPRQAPTRHQFIGGIGIPADLPYESLTVGYVLKAEFWLPYNATVFRENPFLPEYETVVPVNSGRSKTTSKRSALRWNIYAYIVERLQSYGYNGLECLLRAICEANSVQFAKHYNVFAELVHLLLSPSSSLDLDTLESGNYKEAEKVGRTTGACDFYDCNMSVLDWISAVLKVDL